MEEVIDVPKVVEYEKNYVNSVLSTQLQVPALKENEVAIYKLIDCDKIDPSRVEESSGKKLNYQPRWALLGSKRIFDPFKRKKIKILHVTGTKVIDMPDGTQREVPEVKRVIFPHTGVLNVTSEFQETYAFMERISENRDNPWRSPSVTAVFYRVDKKRDLQRGLEDDYLLTDALNWVREANEKELNAVFKSLDKDIKKQINTNEGFEVFKKGVFDLAKKSPILVLRASSNKEAIIKIQCMDAEKFRVLLWDEGDKDTPRRWVWNTAGTETLVSLEPGVHKIDGLVAHFVSKEGKNDYVKMASELRQIFKPS